MTKHRSHSAAFKRQVAEEFLAGETLHGLSLRHGISVSRGCALMGLARSTFYDPAPATLDADEVLARIGAVCDEFECYGYRRVGAALRHQGIVVNSKAAAPDARA